MEYAGHVNVYVCPIGHETVTQNLADGVTPFMIGCRGANGFCDEMAHSSFYRVEQSLRPSFVWEKSIHHSKNAARFANERLGPGPKNGPTTIGTAWRRKCLSTMKRADCI